MKDKRMPSRNRKFTICFLITMGLLVLFRGKTVSQVTSSKISSDSLKAGHELTEVNSKRLMWFGLGLIISAVLMEVSIGAFFFSLRRHDPDPVIHHKAPPEPRLQI